MEQRTRAALAALAIGAIFLLIQLGALALVEPLKQSGYQTVENPQDATNSLVYFGIVLAATAVMLAAIKFDFDWAIRALIVFTGAYIGFIVLGIVAPAGVPMVGGASLLAWAGGGLIAAGLLLYPEWYVIDATGIVMGAGVAGLFGITFGVLPAIVLLSVLAIYDAISVYGTEHMLTLASGVMDMKVPVVLVIPMSLSYSFLDAGKPDAVAEEGEHGDAEPDSASVDEDDDATTEGGDPMDREALFIGLGDAIIPTVLVASAAFFAPESVPSLGVPGLALTLPAATAMVGTFLGLAVLLWMVLKGRAHAGLPLLNGGTIAGYLLGALASGLSLTQALGL